MIPTKVTVIIPVFNAELYVAQCIESVLRQQYSSYKIILVDDCSSDSSWQICQKYSNLHNSIMVLRTSENKGGPAGPRNLALNFVDTEYVAFLDSDDMWAECMLSDAVNKLDKDEGCDLVCSNAQLVDKKSRIVGEINFHRSGISQLLCLVLKRPILVKNYVVNSSVVVRSKYLINERFIEWQPIAALEDWAMWLKLSSNKDFKGICVINKSNIFYRVTAESISHKDRDSQLCGPYLIYAWLRRLGHINDLTFLLLCVLNMLKGGLKSVRQKMYNLYFWVFFI